MSSTKRSEEAIIAQLRTLSAYISDLRESWINSGKLTKRTRSFSVRPDVNLGYIDDPNFVYSIPVEQHEEEEWAAHNMHQLISEEILESSQFASVAASLELAENERPILRSFSSAVAYRSRFRNKEFNEDALIEIATADFLGKEYDYRILMFLTGITLVDETVIVNDSITFRRPTKEDVIEYVSDDTLHYAHAFGSKARFSCICEARYSTTEPYLMQRWTDQIITALQLYQVGSVFSQRINYSCDSFNMFSNFSSGGSVSIAERQKCKLCQADAPRLNEFITAFVPHFPTAYEPDSEPKFLYTALSWYQDSLQSSRPLEGRIASSVACLEALFLHDSKNEEIMYRLKQRVSLLLGRFGLAPLHVRSILTDSYSVRSKYVHGGKKDQKYDKKFTQPKLEELFGQTAEIARLSFLIHFQIEQFSLYEKKELFKLLEDAAIDDRELIHLDDVCNKVRLISSAKIPMAEKNV